MRENEKIVSHEEMPHAGVSLAREDFSAHSRDHPLDNPREK